DLAVANYSSNTISVLLNNGDGTFPPAVNYGAGNGPYSVAILDLDGLNGPDLAVANNNGGNVSVFLNNGNGTFSGFTNYWAGDDPSSVAIADLDGVNGPDLAVASDTCAGGYCYGRIFILLNNGNGTL
ncbi:VCBS repeat-containing protein, partial [candidate division TA06 bacterium]|nr:VCBS repeat-containing protein [candidate division TA06 bacterium]